MISIDTLIQPVTEDQVFETFLTILETIGVPARSWRQGGVARSILRVVARTYAGFSLLISQTIRGQFLDLSSGGWLTLLAYYVYGTSRIEATFATGQVKLTNSGGGYYTFAANSLQMKNPSPGSRNKVYTNTSAITLNPGDTALVDVQAVEIGASSNAAPHTVTAFTTPILGVTVTNPSAIVGNDAQPDDELRQMCRDKLATLSPNGARGAYAYAIRAAKRLDGTPVNVNRHSISASSSTGVVDIYLASPSGTPSAVDISAVASSIESIARPDSVTVNVHAATSVAISNPLVVWTKNVAGVSQDIIRAAVVDALTALSRSYPIGGIPKPPGVLGYLYASTIEGAVENAHPAIYAVDGVSGDILIPAGSVPEISIPAPDVRIVNVP